MVFVLRTVLLLFKSYSNYFVFLCNLWSMVCVQIDIRGLNLTFNG